MGVVLRSLRNWLALSHCGHGALDHLIQVVVLGGLRDLVRRRRVVQVQDVLLTALRHCILGDVGLQLCRLLQLGLRVLLVVDHLVVVGKLRYCLNQV